MLWRPDSNSTIPVASVTPACDPGYGVKVENTSGALPASDGSVEENRRSPATVLNRTRYGAGGDLSVTDPTAEPEWARVAGGGTYVWHDHRIHWMSEAEPPSLAGADAGKIQDWSLDVVVDGAPVVVHGELTREPAPSPWPWLGLAVVAGAATFAAGWRWPRRGPAVALAAAGGLAAVTSLLAELDLPAATGRRWSFVAIPALAALCALGAAVAPRSRYALALLAASAVVLPLWIGLRWSALVNAVLPSPSGAGLQRLAIALALGAVLGTAAVAARSVATSARAAAAEGPAGAPAA